MNKVLDHNLKCINQKEHLERLFANTFYIFHLNCKQFKKVKELKQKINRRSQK